MVTTKKINTGLGKELVHPKNRRSRRERRQLGKRVGAPLQWSLVLGGLAVFAVLARGWSFTGLTVAEIALLPLLALICVWPGIRWYRHGMNWLPLGEAYAATQLFFYVLPAFAGRSDWLSVPPERRLMALAGFGIYLLIFAVIYRVGLRSASARKMPADFLRRELHFGFIWFLFVFWSAAQVAIQCGWLPAFGSLLNFFRSAVTAAGGVAIANLFFRMGCRRLSRFECMAALTGLIGGLAFNILSGFLVESMMIIGMALLSFTLGRKRVPVPALILSGLIFGFLHLGKGDFRTTFWEENTNYSSQRVGLISGYGTWFQNSWGYLVHPATRGSESSLLNRASLLQIVAQAMSVVPESRPFLAGKTYCLLPELLVPRIFNPDKPRGTLPTEIMGIYIGIQTEEGADVTGVTVGPITEGWLNFGWFGLIGAGAFFGFLFALPAYLSRSLNPSQLGWMLASVFLIYATDTAHSIPEMLCSLLHALLVAVVLLAVASRNTAFDSAYSPRRTRGGNINRTNNSSESHRKAEI